VWIGECGLWTETGKLEEQIYEERSLSGPSIIVTKGAPKGGGAAAPKPLPETEIKKTDFVVMMI
jgi:hypothetical protein